MKAKILTILLFLSINCLAQDPSTIKTPIGTTVNVVTYDYDYNDSMKLAIKNYWLAYYNYQITYIEEASIKYNCHAYAWHLSEDGDTVWINTPEEDKYWNDGSYLEVYNFTENLKVSSLPRESS